MKEHFKQLIQNHLESSGEKSIAAATKRGLNRDVFRTILKGHPPNIVRAEEICRALGWEFYIGPPRGGAAGPPAAPPNDADRSDTEDLTAPALAARLDAIQADLKALKSATVGLDDAGALAEAAGDDDPPPGVRHIGVIEAAAAAGDGALIEDAPVAGKVWFRRDWLARYALDPARCVVIGVKGESMEPTLPDGCSILVNYASRRLRAGHIFVLRGGDGLIAKRAAEDDSAWRLVSDHPAWEDIPWTPDHEVVGQVVWMARTLV